MRAWWIGVAWLAACGGGDDVGPGGGDDTAVDTTPGELTEFPEVVPAFRTLVSEFEGLPFASYVPEGAQGLVLLFHGTGGDGPNVVDTIEMIDVLNELVARQIGFLAPTSENRDAAQWDTSAAPGSNVDYQRMLRMRTALIDAGAIQDTTPLFSIGFSNGGTFASYVGNAALEDGLPVKATLIHAMTGNGGRYRDPPRMPVMWLCSENDEKIQFSDCEANHQEHLDRGQVGSFQPHFETRLEPLRFMRTGFFSREQSLSIFRQAVDGGFFSASGERLFPVDQAEQSIFAFTNTYDVVYPKPVNAVLKVVVGAHAINGEHAVAEAEFCAEHASD